MRAILIVLAVAVLMVAPVAVQDAYGEFELTLGGGANAPSGEYGDQTKVGYGFTTGVGYRITQFLSLGAEIAFYGNNASDELSEAFGPGFAMSSRIQQYSGVVKLLLPAGDHHLFAKGVVGSYRGVARVTTPLGTVSVENTDPGYGLGGGFLINGASNSSFFADITYHRIPYDGADEDTTFLSYSVGAIFRFSFSE